MQWLPGKAATLAAVSGAQCQQRVSVLSKQCQTMVRCALLLLLLLVEIKQIIECPQARSAVELLAD